MRADVGFRNVAARTDCAAREPSSAAMAARRTLASAVWRMLASAVAKTTAMPSVLIHSAALLPAGVGPVRNTARRDAR